MTRVVNLAFTVAAAVTLAVALLAVWSLVGTVRP